MEEEEDHSSLTENRDVFVSKNIVCFPLRGKLFVKANPLSLSLEKLELDQSKIEWRLNNALHDHREREKKREDRNNFGNWGSQRNDKRLDKV